MPRVRHGWPLALVALTLLPGPAPACSLCEGLGKREPLGPDYDRAAAVLYGRLANPRLNGVRPGTGTTELHVEQVVKAAPKWMAPKVVTIPSYLPVLDPKNPPRYVVLFRLDGAEPVILTGRQVESPALLDYLRARRAAGDEPTARLRFLADHFDHADPAVADEAFIEFARANDRDIAAAAPKLSAAKLRQLVARPNLEREQASLFAYLLGACGEDRDADLLRDLMEQNKSRRALEGLLCGYISLRPADGWKRCLDHLANPKEDFITRYGAVRTLRFFHNARPAETRDQVLRGMALLVPQGDMADFAINDLCTWKEWDHTALILAQFDRPSHEAPIVRRSIVRYALRCPRPEARAFVERVRRQDAELVRELEDDLRAEGGK